MYGEEGEDFMRWNIACPQTLLKGGLGTSVISFIITLFKQKQGRRIFFSVSRINVLHHLAVCSCFISLPECREYHEFCLYLRNT